MSVTVTRKNTIFQPDSSRVLSRFFSSGDERNMALIKKILALPEKQQQEILVQVLRDFSQRHRSISRSFEKNFNKLSGLFQKMDLDPESLSTAQKVLIGSYFTMEYSIEAAAFFNPSIVEDPDQSGVSRGETRVIISFRATGEGHISSIVFRSGVIDKKQNILIEPPGRWLESPVQVKNYRYEKTHFLDKLREMQPAGTPVFDAVEQKLTDSFTYEELKRYLDEVRTQLPDSDNNKKLLNEVKWIASSHYEMDFFCRHFYF